MARVSVNDCAHHDLRLTAASRALRISRDRLCWRLILVWSRVTESNSPIVPTMMLAAALGKRAEAVESALVDAQLAEYADGESLDLSPMRSLYGDYEWYAEMNATAHAGGKSRAESAARDEAGRFQARDYRSEILEVLSDGVARKRMGLRRLLRAQNEAVRKTVRDLLAEGIVVELDDRRLTLADLIPCDDSVPTAVPETVPVESVPPVAMECIPPVAAEPVPPSSPSSAPALALVPVPAPARESESRPLACTHVQAERITLDSTMLVPPAQRRQVARLLWEYQNRRRTELDNLAPDIPLDDIPGGSLDAVILALAKYSPAQCKHALDVFVVEGACRGDQGGDPLEFLNGHTNWRREQLARAIASTPAAVRKRFAKARGPTARRPTEPQRTVEKLR